MATIRWRCRFVAELAFEFRQKFKRDVVIDMYCYRRYGHNEADEPLFTQPELYAKIDKQPVGRAHSSSSELIAAGVLTAEDAGALEDGVRAAPRSRARRR